MIECWAIGVAIAIIACFVWNRLVHEEYRRFDPVEMAIVSALWPIVAIFAVASLLEAIWNRLFR